MCDCGVYYAAYNRKDLVWRGQPIAFLHFFFGGLQGDDARQMRQAEKDLFRYRREITLRFKIQERDLSLL